MTSYILTINGFYLKWRIPFYLNCVSESRIRAEKIVRKKLKGWKKMKLCAVVVCAVVAMAMLFLGFGSIPADARPVVGKGAFPYLGEFRVPTPPPPAPPTASHSPSVPVIFEWFMHVSIYIPDLPFRLVLSFLNNTIMLDPPFVYLCIHECWEHWACN